MAAVEIIKLLISGQDLFSIAFTWLNSNYYPESLIDKWVIWAAIVCGLFK